MTVDFNFDEEKPKSERDATIAKILGQFSGLSPEKQAEVMKYIDYVNQKDDIKKGRGHIS